MQAVFDWFWSGALATAVATSSGPVGTIVYVLIGITLFVAVAWIIVSIVRRFSRG